MRERTERRAARVIESEEEEYESDEEEAERERESHWIGMIVHALLSWKARIGRMIRGETRARAAMPAAKRFGERRSRLIADTRCDLLERQVARRRLTHRALGSAGARGS